MGGVAIVLFSDLVDSTALLASLGDDRMEEVGRAHLGDLTATVDAAGGGVERLDTERDRVGIAARVGIPAGEPIADGEDLHGMAVVDSGSGRARLLEPAPLDAAVTVHFGLADWVRTNAGLEEPLRAMAAGRCSIEGDAMIAARLSPMFGGD